MKYLLIVFTLQILFLSCPGYMLVKVENEVSDFFVFETDCGDVHLYGIYHYKKNREIQFTLKPLFQKSVVPQIDSTKFFTRDGENLEISIYRASTEDVKYSNDIYIFNIPDKFDDDIIMQLDRVIRCNNEYVSLPEVEFTLK